MLEKFTMAKLSEVDGGLVARMLDLEVQRCLDDCHDRPRLEKPRKVVLTITVTPEPTDNGQDLASIDVGFHVKTATLPPKQTRDYNMVQGPDGALRVNELSPEDARQRTIDEVKPKGPKAVTHAG